MSEIAGRFIIHFFSSCGLVLGVSFALALLQRKKPQPWLPCTLQQIIVTAAILVFAVSTLREAYDVSQGGLLVKSVFDFISWAGGSTVSVWGLLRLRKWAREEKMRTLLTVLSILLCAGFAQAQATVTFQWDASPDAATAPADNPVRYRFYQCSDQALTQCTVAEKNAAMEHPVTLGAGTYYCTVRAWWYGVVADGTQSIPLESGNSNVLMVRVTVPPGNPANTRVRVVQVGETRSGQTLKTGRQTDE